MDVKIIAATTQPTCGGASAGGGSGRTCTTAWPWWSVTLPPLRERGEDILLLAEQFLQRYAEAHGLPPSG